MTDHDDWRGNSAAPIQPGKRNTMQTTIYIKGFFRASAAAAAKLEELGVENTAHYIEKLDGLWDSVSVPDGLFKHKPGSPALPGWLDLA